VKTEAEHRAPAAELDTDVAAPARPRLAVAYDWTSSSPLELVAAVAGRWEVVWVVEADRPELGPLGRLLPRLGTVVDVAGRSPWAVADSLRSEELSGVVAFSDNQLPVAALLAESLRLEGNPLAVVDVLTDKAAQRRALEAAGIAVPRHVQLPAGSSLAEVRALVGGLHYPVVVKPRRGSSSRSVSVVATPDQLAEMFGPRPATDPLRHEDHLAEEWLADGPPVLPGLGNYVSVEAVAQRGVVVPLAITGKFPTASPCRETGNFMPHPLGRAAAEQVADLAVRSATALGVRSGALHIEIKLTPDGPRIIEINGRVGGGGIDALYEAAHGRSLTEIAARVALGERLDLEPESAEPQPGPYRYSYYSQPPEDAVTVVSADGVDRALALTGVASASVNKGLGDILDSNRGSQGFVASFRGTADTLEDLAGVPTAIEGALDYRYERREP
jgi:hypothetical protein